MQLTCCFSAVAELLDVNCFETVVACMLLVGLESWGMSGVQRLSAFVQLMSVLCGLCGLLADIMQRLPAARQHTSGRLTLLLA